MNLGELVRRAARAYGDRTAVVDGDRQVSFAELEERANRFANAMLRRGRQSVARLVSTGHGLPPIGGSN